MKLAAQRWMHVAPETLRDSCVSCSPEEGKTALPDTLREKRFAQIAVQIAPKHLPVLLRVEGRCCQTTERFGAAFVFLPPCQAEGRRGARRSLFGIQSCWLIGVSNA